ncbi:hypothetical protein EAS1808013_014240 [Enterobacter asburiae]|nr:hypothetical protein EAS1808013_014240 [Enterobacter asburiae]
MILGAHFKVSLVSSVVLFLASNPKCRTSYGFEYQTVGFSCFGL